MIPLLKDNLNLSMSFFALCLFASSSCPSCCHNWFLAALCWFFCLFVCLLVCFHRNRICCPSINQTSPSQWVGLFPFIIICRQKKYLQTGTLGLCMSPWIENNLCIHWKIISTWYIMVKFGLHKYKKIIWLDKNQALKMILSCITSCEDHELWKLSTVFVHWCYQPIFFCVCVFFFPIWVFLHKHSQTTGLQGKGGILLTPHYHFLPHFQTLRH